MILLDVPLLTVSQGFLSGWKVQSKLTGAVAIPNWLLKERIGLTWMQVRKTKRALSIDSRHTENVMFGSFGMAVLDPSGEDGENWKTKSPDELADEFILTSNQDLRVAAEVNNLFRRP